MYYIKLFFFFFLNIYFSYSILLEPSLNELIFALSSSKEIVLLAFAPWCTSCKAIWPYWETIDDAVASKLGYLDYLSKDIVDFEKLEEEKEIKIINEEDDPLERRKRIGKDLQKLEKKSILDEDSDDENESESEEFEEINEDHMKLNNTNSNLNDIDDEFLEEYEEYKKDNEKMESHNKILLKQLKNEKIPIHFLVINCEKSLKYTKFCIDLGIDRYPSFFYKGSEKFSSISPLISSQNSQSTKFSPLSILSSIFSSFSSANTYEPINYSLENEISYPFLHNLVRYTADIYTDALYDWILLMNKLNNYKNKKKLFYNNFNLFISSFKNLIKNSNENEIKYKKINIEF